MFQRISFPGSQNVWNYTSYVEHVHYTHVLTHLSTLDFVFLIFAPASPSVGETPFTILWYISLSSFSTRSFFFKAFWSSTWIAWEEWEGEGGREGGEDTLHFLIRHYHTRTYPLMRVQFESFLQIFHSWSKLSLNSKHLQKPVFHSNKKSPAVML